MLGLTEATLVVMDAWLVIVADCELVLVGTITVLTYWGREAATTPLPVAVVVPVTWSKSVQLVPW